MAGEESGEIYGARLMRELKVLKPDAQFCGMGGDRMVAEGLRIIRHCRDMESIGVAQMLKKLSFYTAALNETVALVKEKKIDAVILIDYPDFNLRVARAASEAGLPVFYYVCPQFWAWRSYRIRAIKKWVDTMLVILPFEEDFYKKRKVKALFVGHPMLDEMEIPPDRESLKKELLPKNADTLVGLFPGSRNSEVDAILGRLLETADRIHAQKTSVGFVIPIAPNIASHKVKKAVKGRSYVKVIKGCSHRVMLASELVITKSGTSTIEGVIAGAPMLIVYYSSFFSYWLAKLLVHVRYAGLPNLIAGREVAREFFQHHFLPARVATAALEILDNPREMEKARSAMAGIRAKLGEKGAAKRAAKIIFERLASVKG